MKALTKNNTKITKYYTRMWLCPGGGIIDCTADGHDMSIKRTGADKRAGWIRLVFIADRYAGKRLVIEGGKPDDGQIETIARVIKLSGVQAVSLYDLCGHETRIVSATAAKYVNEVDN
jgi:hypothetical protein